ncbi:MAG TPA: two-component regulator propeller domain-containing protein, partial [Clostridia bacterium]|nr:two-component regulator propeller domain-containing protein [Clostridia bacterium]
MNCWQLLTAVCLLWLTAAQSRAEAPAGFDVHVWGVDEGLPQSAVLTLTQTRDGYLWIGTLDGLARFDGIRFTTFREANTPGLTSSRILTLFEDSQRNLWIGTETAGVFLIKDGRVISLDIGRGTRQGSLMSASEDQSGAVWLYTADGQLCRYQSNRVDVWNAGAGRASNCRAVITDNSGLTWVGTDWTLTAIGKVPPGPAVALPVVHEFQFPVIVKLEALLASKSGGYWRLANGRIEKWQGDQRQKDLGPYPWAGTNNVPVRAVCEDLEGNLIVGTHGDGVYWFDAEGSYTHLSTNIQVNASVLSLAMDREGCLWVGSNGGGLARIRKQFFQTLDSSRGSTVQTVAADRQGGIWIGYNEQRVDHWTPQRTLSFTNFQTALDPYAPRLGDWFVRSVFFDSAQRVWAGTLNGGLLRLSDGFFRPEPGPGALRKDVAAIYEDRSSRLWAGTAGGLAGWDGTNWTVYNQTNGLSANTVRAIVEDREGALWVGTDAGGLNRLHNGRFDWFGKTNGLPSDNISALLADNEGALWVGTASGLARGRDGQWTSFAERLGPAANSVAYLLEDGAGHLWIGSTAGLLRVPKKDLNELASSTRTLFPRLYGRADGLPASECTQGSQPAACRTADGRVYFPTIQGVASASLDSLRPNTNPPPVMIEAVYIDSQMQGATSLRAKPAAEVTVRPGNNALEIQFTSLNLAYPEKARFRYRLEPYETGWNEVGTDRRFARYPKLPPGNYVFEVTACNEDRFWNPAPASLAVVVLPPFWRTW